MAIKIPSRNIYEKDNDKIRDNKIDRIEVGAFEVLPNNEYDKPVYNLSISTSDEIFSQAWQEKFDFKSASSSTQVVYAGVVAGLLPCYKKEIDIAIPKLVQNKLISQLKTGEDENNNSNVKYSVEYKKYEGVATITGNGYSADNYIDEIVSKNFSYTEQYAMAKGALPKKIEVREESTGLTTNFLVEAKVELDDETNLGEEIILREDDDFWYAKVTVLCGIEMYFATTGLIKSQYSHTNPITMTGKCEKYEPISVEITFYGNTIGIDLQDKTIYVPNQEGSKPFSVEGNELMQTGSEIAPFDIDNLEIFHEETTPGYVNCWVALKNGTANNNIRVRAYLSGTQRTFTIEKGENESDRKPAGLYDGEIFYIISATTDGERIVNAFSKTQAHYAKGKETATIRCSISDYYDENGAKVIATNNSNKMAFDIYDEVIPYSYGADGNDKPLSRHKDGSPKTFVVLGTRIFYDGAVWQELTLQEK